MINYRYTAKNEHGKQVSGNMQAQDEFDLHDKLKANNLYLISSKAQIDKVNNKRLKSSIVAEFSRNIGELLGAGVTLVKALRIIADDESIKPKEKELYNAILKLVRSGMALSDALTEQGDAFPPLFINMIKSAEQSGNMDKIALQMAEHYSKEYKLSQKVKSSMTYPKILGVLIVLVVAIIMGYVIPQFDSLFSQMDSLPVTTTVLLNISNFVKKKWYVLVLAAIILFIIFKLVFSIPAVRYAKDKMEISLPVIGKLRRVIYTARFARTMSSLYSAGISIINCLIIAKNTIGNSYIEKQFEQVIAEVRAGENLSTALDHVDGFTKKLSSSVMVGEETGALDSMLVSIANQMEYDSEVALNKLVSLLEPAMIVFMAVIVGFIIISVIQPIYGSYETISGSVK